MREPSVIETRARTILIAGLVIFSLLHLYGLTNPPNGYHQWRESDTSAIILNYFQEDHSFLEPRMNQRGDGSGITGMELPLYQYTAMLLYFITGPSHAVCRLLTMLGALAGVMAFFGLVRRVNDDLTAATSSWALLFSPLFLFYSSKIMPDVWMLGFLLIAAYWYVRYLENSSLVFWMISFFALTCSAAIKPLGLCLYLPFLIMTWRQKRGWTEMVRFGAYALISFGATLAWYLYARGVTAASSSGAFDLGDDLAQAWRTAFSWDFVNHILLQWPWELWIGWSLVPVCAVGLFRVFRNTQYRLFGWWLAGGMVVMVLLASNTATQDYYTLIMVPPLAVLTGLGASYLLTHPSWMSCIGLVLLLVAPVTASARIAHRVSAVPEFDAIRRDADLHIERSSLVAVQDATTAVRLYQLNRHGWPIRFEVTYDRLKTAIDHGAGFVILDKDRSTYADSVRMLLDTAAIAIGPLKGYRPAGAAGSGH